MDELKSPLHFTKMQGAGNSFLLSWESVAVSCRAKLTKFLSNPNFGVGADGVVFLSSEKKDFFVWDFYNSDGSKAEFCGNAARCVALFIFEKEPDIKNMVIKTLAGEVSCQIKGKNLVEVQMPKVEWLSKSLSLPNWSQPMAWLNTGVPHLVVEVQKIDDLKKYKSEAAQMRTAPQLGPGGANVTFLFQHSLQKISAVSYERGVEDFTLACGTGAVAAASFMMEKYKTSDCHVEMPGGHLNVVLTDGKILMTGEAYKIAELTLSGEVLKGDLS